jgi:hypothetical protein
MNPNNSMMMAVMAQVGVPALRVVFGFALIALVFGGIFLFRRRPQFFDRAPDVVSDSPVVRQSGEETIIIIGSALMLLLVGILHQVWSA